MGGGVVEIQQGVPATPLVEREMSSSLGLLLILLLVVQQVLGRVLGMIKAIWQGCVKLVVLSVTRKLNVSQATP